MSKQVSKSLLQSGSTPSRPDILITPTSGPLHVLDGKSQELFDFVCQVQPRLHWFNGARRTTNSVVKHRQEFTSNGTLEMLTPQLTFAEAVVLLPPPRDSDDFNEASSGRLTYVGFEDNDFTPLEKPATSTASPKSKKNVNKRRVMQSRICTGGEDLAHQVYGTFGDDETFTEMKPANYQPAAPVDRGTPPGSSSSLVSDWIVKPLKELVREELYGTAVEDGELQHAAQIVSSGTTYSADEQAVATTQGGGNKMGGKAIAKTKQNTSRYRNERVSQAILMQKSTARGPGRGKEKVNNRSIMATPTATSSTLQLLSPTGTPSNRLSCVPREKARMLQSLCSWPYQLFGSSDLGNDGDSNCSRVPASKKFLDMTNLWTANSTPELLNKADNDSEEDEYETVEGTVARDYKGCKKANSSSSTTSLSSRNRKKKEEENNYCGGQTGALGSISALTEELKQEFATDVRALRRKLVFEALGLVLPVVGDENEDEMDKNCTKSIPQHLASPAVAGTKEQNRNEQDTRAPVERKILLRGGAQETPQGEQKNFYEGEAVSKQIHGWKMELDVDDEEGTIREDAEEPSTDSETSSVVGRDDQIHADTTGIIAEQMTVKRSPAPDNLNYEPIFPRKFYEHESWAGRDEKKHLQYPAQELYKSKHQITPSSYNFPERITTGGEETFPPGRPLPKTTNLEVALNDQHYIENKLREKLLREKFNYQFRKVMKEEEDRARRNKETKSSSAHFLNLREGREDVDPAALSVASTPCYHFEDPGLQVEDPEEIEKMLADCGLEEVEGKELQLHSSGHSAASLAQCGGDRGDNTGGEVDHKVLGTPLEDDPQAPSRGPVLDVSCEDQEINVTSASAPARASTFIDVECKKEVEEETEHLIDLLFSSVAKKVATDYKVLQKCCHAEVVTEDTISISRDKGAAGDEATDDKSAESAREQQAPLLNPAVLPRPHFVREKVQYFEKRISTVLDADHNYTHEGEPQAAPSGSFGEADAEERTNERVPGIGIMKIVGAVAAASPDKKGEEFLQETKSKRIAQPTEVVTTEVVLSSPPPEQSPCSTTTGFNTSSVLYPEQSPCPSSTLGSSSARSDEVDVIKAGIDEEVRPSSSYASSVSEEEAGRGNCAVEENTSEGRDEDYISQVDVFTTTAKQDQKPVRNSKNNKSNSLPAKQPGAALVRPQPRGQRATPSQDKSARYMGPAPTRDITQTEASLRRLLAKDPSLYIPAATTKSKNRSAEHNNKNGFQTAADDDTKTRMKNVLCHSRSREIDTRGDAANDHLCVGEKTTEATATDTPSARPKQLSSTEFTRLPTLFIQHNGVDHNSNAIDNQENEMVMHLVEFV